MSLGTRLKNLRRANKLTQKEVATRLEIDNTTISKWEADIYEPNADTLDKLATLYDTTVDHLLGRTTLSDLHESLKRSAQLMKEDPALKEQSADSDTTVGRAFFGGADKYTEEEIEVARAAARAAIEAMRKARKQKE
ncbi:helix-turn-helix domain-containing protein [Paenibacillus albus]|uniref:XRE family transcriptional regulator n=1 Tax=Paenibacillus albus TaxID=2495582 RepID=A0A3Q8XAJ7_9BACL|nr:helix-turn-helix transcriptional regulator [Paenibacillus albus]AZN43387.1 XRE family transcriptional regulator [Paenibacillus albus]